MTTTTLEYGLYATAAATVDGDTVTIPLGAVGPITVGSCLAVGQPRVFARIVGHVADDTTETLTVAWED